MIKLFVGLDNPGSQYAGTRHNAGFWWIDAVARQLGATLAPERSQQALLARKSVHGQAIWLMEPQTFMNLSGRPVAALARFYKIAPQEILVAHDELDLPPGQAKLKLGGGHAGHNGLRDIHAQLGSGDYWRLRLGIGHPGDKSQVIGWVLGHPPAEDRTLIETTVARAAQAFDLLAAGQMERATAQIHTTAPPRPKPPRAQGETGSGIERTERRLPESSPRQTPNA